MDRRRFLMLASTSVFIEEISVAKALSVLSSSADEAKYRSAWELSIEQPNQAPIFVESFMLPEIGEHVIKKSLSGFEVEASIRSADSFWEFSARVRSSVPGRMCFLSLSRSYEESSKPLNFNGEVVESAVYRQSPHNPQAGGLEKAMQSVPLVALATSAGMEMAICDTPAHFDNYTSQTCDLEARRLILSSGDHGLNWNAGTHAFEPVTTEGMIEAEHRPRIEPHAFSLNGGKEHAMDAILMRSPAVALPQFRQQVNLGVARHWSKGKIVDLLGATYFGTAYMNLRVNETGRSRYWVVPAIEYSNKQYSRDAFWISMMLPPEYSQSCFENEASYDTAFTGAERQLFTLVWAYRNHRNGFAVDLGRVERILRIVETHAPESYYSGFTTQTRKIGCWQGWADVIAFDRDDTISNNQGLFVVALLCAQAMGIETKVSVDQALDHYRGLFSTSLGAYPISRKRTDILAVDPLMGDLLAQYILGKSCCPPSRLSRTTRRSRKRPGQRTASRSFVRLMALIDETNTIRKNIPPQLETPLTAAISAEALGTSMTCKCSWTLIFMARLMPRT